jgi:hypothetical protein
MTRPSMLARMTDIVRNFKLAILAAKQTSISQEVANSSLSINYVLCVQVSLSFRLDRHDHRGREGGSNTMDIPVLKSRWKSLLQALDQFKLTMTSWNHNYYKHLGIMEV